MRIEIPAAAWNKLTPAQRTKVSAIPKRVALGQPACIDKQCVFDHPAITEADSKAVAALIRSYKAKRKAPRKEKLE